MRVQFGTLLSDIGLIEIPKQHKVYLFMVNVWGGNFYCPYKLDVSLENLSAASLLSSNIASCLFRSN